MNSQNVIKLIYIDKQNWNKDLELFRLNNIWENNTHEFTAKESVISLYNDNEDATFTTIETLKQKIEEVLSKRKLDNIVIVDLEVNLEYIFNTLLSIAKKNNIDITIIDKSKHPIRSNITMSIDLNEYGETKYEDVKEILHDNLEGSLSNARKSKSPQESSDLGVDINHTSDFHKELLSTFADVLNEEIEGILEIDDSYIDFDPFSSFDVYTSTMDGQSVSIIDKEDEVSITKGLDMITLSKEELKKVIKILGVMINE